MQSPLNPINVRKLKLQLRRVRIACAAAIELGDCKAVARLTCEAGRLMDYLRLAPALD
jgi:hypothetical protein